MKTIQLPSSMSNSCAEVNIHFVLAVKRRSCPVQEIFREELEEHIKGIVQQNGHELLAVYCMPDHAHIFLKKLPGQSESDLIREIKAKTTLFMNESQWMMEPFAWRKGYRAFPHSNAQVDRVMAYILNQPEHHRMESFRTEYASMLKRFEAGYRKAFLFKQVEDQ